MKIAMAIGVAGIAGATLAASLSLAQDKGSAAAGIEQYRAALADGNPAELWEARGEGLWKEKRGPKKASLERCDLGLGPGVVKGAYTILPKYFPDTDKVEDLESRLVTCMVTLQGFTPEQAKKDPFGGPGKKVPMDALVAYVTSESRGMPMHVSLAHPKEKEAYELGREIFFYRGGSHDFGCTSCHGADGKRIRLQDLPNLTNPADARRAYSTWPAYRVSQGEVRSMQWRLNDCFRQQRFPELEFVSPASIALTLYLAKNADGAKFDAPAIKR
ncbi:MAG TPA: sulfur oxidation c-type cytochrome SoxA [Usitatibacter sp.]|jgi:sulfur-oxidizing protein SoxA|nr:sulfur oxidation c-type cytochrome SoxA [Usitatibacter sp.]